MSTITVRTHFAAGHRILGLVGPGAKCKNIHGHTFRVEWVFEQAEGLEFGALKSLLRSMITEKFDHAFIVDYLDPFRSYLNDNKLKHYLLQGKPTTEAISAEIAELSQSLVPQARLIRVSLDEGPDNNATWEAAHGLTVTRVVTGAL